MSLKLKEFETPTVYDRIYLNYPGRNLVIEYVDGYCQYNEYNLDEWWVFPPNHINYFSHDSLQELLRGCGYKIIHWTSSFPLDMFLLFGDQYVGNPKLGRECHNKRVKFEHLMEKHGKVEKLKKINNALSELN